MKKPVILVNPDNPEGVNQKLTKADLAKIRRLDDFDLTMLVSEIHDHGWPAARQILGMMPEKEEPEK